ncbi:MAG: type I restriction-modification system subunit M N-terminal domain-containing protein [Candidatus Competibacter sp.]
MPKLSLAKLERHLYSAADRLRQEGLDAATYKDYIFGMLFLKRCSDVFESERDRIVGRKVEQGMIRDEAETRYGENPDYYDGFFVPERARWRYLQSVGRCVQGEVDPIVKTGLSWFQGRYSAFMATGLMACRHTPRWVFGSSAPDEDADGCRS